MLDNEFDQIFRDRLLDHPSKIRLSLWKQVHTHLLRHKALHFWKWYFVGPSAVVVAVTGYIVIATLHSSSHNKQKAPVAAVATYEARPAADSPATTAAQTTMATQATQAPTAPDSPAANSNSTPAGATPTVSTPVAAIAKTPAPTAATTSAAATNAAAATNDAAAATSSTTRPSAASAPLHRSSPITHTARRNPHLPNSPNSPTSSNRSNSPSGAHQPNDLTTSSRSATTTNTPTNTHPRHLPNAHNKKASDATANEGNEANGGNNAGDASTANEASGANDARSPNGTTGAHNTRPTRSATHPAAPVKLIALKTPAVVTAKTPNSKSPHQLIVPAPRPRTHIPFNVDLFGAPEYFTWKTIGLSYGAGARVTVIFKDHWTITSGLQYQRINVNHVKNIDSLNGLLPGYFTNFHIPLFLGYTTGNDRFSFTVNAGVLFSLYTQANGSLSQADNWSNHNGINSYLGLNFSTYITNRVSLFAEPYLKCWYPPGDQRLPPQLWSTGIIVGFRYKF